MSVTLGQLLTEGYERVYDEIRDGDYIRTMVGISKADDKWIGTKLSELGSAARSVEVWRKDEPDLSISELLCQLSEFFHSRSDLTQSEWSLYRKVRKALGA